MLRHCWKAQALMRDSVWFMSTAWGGYWRCDTLTDL